MMVLAVTGIVWVCEMYVYRRVPVPMARTTRLLAGLVTALLLAQAVMQTTRSAPPQRRAMAML